MIKKSKRVIVMCTCLALCLTTLQKPFYAGAKTAVKPTLSIRSISLQIRDTAGLTLKHVSTKKSVKIKWKSSDKKIVTVSPDANNPTEATIKAKKKGKADITASLSGQKLTCRVTVTGDSSGSEPVPSENPANINRQSDVTEAMMHASYWADKLKDADTVLMDMDSIQKKNEQIIADPDCVMYDLRNMKMEYDATAKKEALAKATIDELTERVGTRTTIYKNGIALDSAAISAWFDEMKNLILDTPTQTTATKKYAICTKRANQWMAPNADLIGWSATDPDDEFLNNSINVNAPFIVDAVTADGKFFHGVTTNCIGWVEADHFAICDDKATWLSQWDVPDDQTLVVINSRISLDLSFREPASSGVMLMLGTRLPLVPKDQIPETISERGSWYNYVVYLPTRDTAGKLVKTPALISVHQGVHVGSLPLTKRNILNVAFSCLGDRYGWGGMLDSMDCSLFTCSIYRCFGLELPRNTTQQRVMPTYKVELSEMNDDEKRAALSKLSAGALLMFSGHITMYIGEENGKQYVINDVGRVSETEASVGADPKVINIYCVSINSLDVRRANGHTWLTELLTAIVPYK